ncbi:hypothetical protein [Desulfosporosinus shakirovi]|uniref:hypothetical protein n=1 Tax=Desulfosporosinus shakirovi TaxID=2885154 RepID=UPI001E65CD89|nr:hypothetical protein [Desulfosporosinus sp. SRJS8]MCB8818468.1 hypothetical protein [Desulfosporosinus sp. SRJS8]
MPYITTGLLSNASFEGVRQSSTLSVNISNDDTSNVAIQIEGFFESGTSRVKYVEEFFTLTAGTVLLKNYFIPFNAFEFIFFVSSQAVEISVGSKDDTGSLSLVRLEVTEEVV